MLSAVFACGMMVIAAATGPAPGVKNFLLIAIDDLRPLFGKSFDNEEVLTPHMDKHFLDGGGSAMQHSYVQVAVCGPSRASILTGRRPDTTHVGVDGVGPLEWCWCQRTGCKEGELFMTFPAWFAQNGYVTAGAGKIYHPDACEASMRHMPSAGPDFAHLVGDDARAWNYGTYGVEGLLERPFDNTTEQFSEEQWGVIPGPNWGGVRTTGPGSSWMKSPLMDEQQTDGQIATATAVRLANFSKEGIGKNGINKPFFLAAGFHKPHTPWIVPEKYFDLYDMNKISLPPNPRVPLNFKEENWHANGNVEIINYNNPGPQGPTPFNASAFGFNQPVDNQTTRELRLAYFAATSFIDAQVGRVLDALETEGYAENTVVALWSDHGYHLGDTNSWCKMTNFEKATRNTMMWRIPGQVAASQGRNNLFVEMVDFFPTVIELMGLPTIPTCEGVDQPPTVLCLQGQSYASQFVPALASASASAATSASASASKVGMGSASAGKEYIFSQWPYTKKNSPGETIMRMAYTVRTTDGHRFTQYVPYSVMTHQGAWTNAAGTDDLELYDYGADPNETTNQAGNNKYAPVVARLKAVLKEQYAPTSA